MNKEELKLIEQLANKLGTTTEYLWSVLLKQAYIQSVITIFQFFIIWIFGYFLLKIHKKLSSDSGYGAGNRYGGYEHYGDYAVIPMFISAIVFAFLVIVAFFSIESVFYGLFNPEYWALNKILDTIR